MAYVVVTTHPRNRNERSLHSVHQNADNAQAIADALHNNPILSSSDRMGAYVEFDTRTFVLIRSRERLNAGDYMEEWLLQDTYRDEVFWMGEHYPGGEMILNTI